MQERSDWEQAGGAAKRGSPWSGGQASHGELVRSGGGYRGRRHAASGIEDSPARDSASVLRMLGPFISKMME